MTDDLASLQLIGGRPALDFVNTEGGERNGPPERIGSYGDLVAWSRHAGVVAAEEAESLEHGAGSSPEVAVRVYERAIELREVLYRVFTEAVAGRRPSEEDRRRLDREVSAALARRRLVPAADGDGAEVAGYEWRLEGEPGALALPLWRIAEDAASLLTSDVLARVKECRGDACTWLFVDESRNRSRRWCDMGDCGNRAKARRYRERHGG